MAGQPADRNEDPPAVVLVLGAPGTTAEDDACIDLLTPKEASTLSCLHVSLVGSPDELATAWRVRVDDLPARTGVLFDETYADTEAIEAAYETHPTATLELRSIGNPGDLTRLGMDVTKLLREVHAPDRQLVACFDSASVLLRTENVDRVFRFLHLLGQRFREAEALFHIHLDPESVDDTTVHTIRQLADRVIEVEDTD